MSTIESRRDLVVHEYVRLQKTQQEIADAHGLTRGIVSNDLKARGVKPRPRGWRPGTTISEEARRRISEGARAWSKSADGRKRLTDPAPLERLHEGHHRYRDGRRAKVERLKAERGLVDTAELIKQLRRVGLPRSSAAIVGYVSKGLIEPERDLGFPEFPKPTWLFTQAKIDKLIARLLDYPDGRLRRWTPDTPEKAAWRAGMITKLHGPAAGKKENGRLAPMLAAGNGKKPGRRRRLAPDEMTKIYELHDAGKSQDAIAITVGVTRKQVRGALAERERLEREGPADRKSEIMQALSAGPLTLKELCASRRAEPPGIGGVRNDVRRILESEPELFECWTGEEARALGRRRDATVWALRVG